MIEFTQAPDIEERILTALETIFTDNLITNVQANDPLRLKVLRVSPLQADPTLSAPWVTFAPDSDIEKGMRQITTGIYEKQYGSMEIGGPIRYVYHYKALVGTPFQTTRETMWAQLMNLTNRVCAVLIQHYDLSSILGPGEIVSADWSKRIEGANKALIDQIIPRGGGGQQTWFGQSTITWHYPVCWYL